MFALIASVTFLGGSDQDLASWMGRQLNGSVAVLIEPDRAWKRFEVETKGKLPNEAEIEASANLSLIRSNLETLGFGVDAKAWPAYMWWATSGSQGLEAWNPNSWKPGSRFETPKNGYIMMKPLGGYFKGKLDWHWFFDDTLIAVSAPTGGIKDVVPVVGLAVGAKVVEKDGYWKLELDPSVLRKRFLGLRDSVMKSSNLHPAQRHNIYLTAEAFSSISNAQLVKLYEKKTNQLEMMVPVNSKLHKVTMERLEARYPSNGTGVAKMVREQLERDIDWSKGVGLRITPKGTASSFLYFKPGHGPNGSVRLVL